MTTPDNLFSVTSTAPDYHGHKNVRFRWFVHAPKIRRPYQRMIWGYKPASRQAGYSECAVDELFTEREAMALKQYLDQCGSFGATEIKKADLPYPYNVAGWGAHPVGGGIDFYELNQHDGYSLPFIARGYYDIRESDPPNKDGQWP